MSSHDEVDSSHKETLSHLAVSLPSAAEPSHRSLFSLLFNLSGEAELTSRYVPDRGSRKIKEEVANCEDWPTVDGASLYW